MVEWFYCVSTGTWGPNIYLLDRTKRPKAAGLIISHVRNDVVNWSRIEFLLWQVDVWWISNPGYDESNEWSSQPALVWSGITSYCYDCTSVKGCGYCGNICIPGDKQGPSNDVSCEDWKYKTCKQNTVGYFSVFFMVAYLLSFGVAMGPLPWTINSEIYPLRNRSLAVSISQHGKCLFRSIQISVSMFFSFDSPHLWVMRRPPIGWVISSSVPHFYLLVAPHR